MKNWTLFLTAAALTLAANGAFAQRDAASKIDGEAYEAPYFAWTAGMYQSHALDHSLALSDYTSTVPTVPQKVTREHADAIRKNLESARKLYTNLGEATQENETAKQHVGAIIKQQDKALEALDKLQNASAGAETDSAKLREHTANVINALRSAQEGHGQLLNHLKLNDEETTSQDATNSQDSEE